MSMFCTFLLIFLLDPGAASPPALSPPSTAPTTAPATSTDANVDWLLSQPAPTASAPTAPAPALPATRPATQPSPLVNKSDPAARTGTVTLSDGTTLKGHLSTTPGKPLRLWSDSEKRYIDIPWDTIASMKVVVVWEKMEDDWRYKETGSDIKVLSGKQYPAHELQYHIVQSNGDEFEGGLVAPVLIQSGEQSMQKVLHKRDKGQIGQTLKDLVYITRIDFDRP